ncbi:hypothetical protein PanWU01x14_304510, partial [Parasponia andersonii]
TTQLSITRLKASYFFLNQPQKVKKELNKVKHKYQLKRNPRNSPCPKTRTPASFLFSSLIQTAIVLSYIYIKLQNFAHLQLIQVVLARLIQYNTVYVVISPLRYVTTTSLHD